MLQVEELNTMSKIIIHISDDVTDKEAITAIADVISEGKISQTNNIEHYCHLTNYADWISVSCQSKREGLCTFKVWKEK